MRVDVDRALEFIREQHEAVMLTYRRDGAPQLSPVACNVDAAGRSWSARGRPRSRPRTCGATRACRCACSRDGFYGNWIQVDGTAEVVSLPDAMEPLVDYYRSTAGEHPDWDDYRAAMERDQRVMRADRRPSRAGPDRSG